MFNWSKWSLGGKKEGTEKGFIYCTRCTDKWGIAVQTAAVCFQPEPEPYHAWGSEQLIYGKQCLGAPAGPGDQQGQISPCLVLEQSYTHTQCVCAMPRNARTSRASDKHYICRQMALSESGCRAATGVGIPTNSRYTDYFQDSVFLLSCCCDLSQNKLFHVLSKPRCWFLEFVLVFHWSFIVKACNNSGLLCKPTSSSWLEIQP